MRCERSSIGSRPYALAAALALWAVPAVATAIPVLPVVITRAGHPNDLSNTAANGLTIRADLEIVSVEPEGSEGNGRVVLRLTNASSPEMNNIIRRFAFDGTRDFGDQGAILSRFAGFDGSSAGLVPARRPVRLREFPSEDFTFGFSTRRARGGLAPGESVDLIFDLGPGTGLGPASSVIDWLALYDDPETERDESAGTVGVLTKRNHRSAWGGRGVFGASGIDAGLPEANPPAAIPEPSAGALLLTGLTLFVLGKFLRRVT